MTPIQKTKFSTELTNFHPISVLPVLSKVLERVVYSQLISYLLHNNLFSDCQSGFHPNYSTQDVLLHITDSWRRAIDDGKFTAVAFLDISKAFDSVNHDILTGMLWCIRELSYLVCELLIMLPAVSLFTRVSSQWGEVSVGVPLRPIIV